MPHNVHAGTAAEVAALLASAPCDEVDALCERYADDPRAMVQRALRSAARRAERERAERSRVLDMYALARELGGPGLVLGVDEVGRGAIAGPLCVAAVALPDEPVLWGINDSKQLTPARREALAARIAQVALAIGLYFVPAERIDEQGMAASLREAMAGAVEASGVEADAVLIDGNPVHAHPREVTIVHGDARVSCIAAASIVAKVARDELMVSLSDEYPGYHWDECKGYASAAHVAQIRAQGLTPLHRKTFCGNFLPEPTLF